MKHRLYTFVNHLYMSPIQWGIQTAHVVSTLSVRYKVNTKELAAYNEWAKDEPTIIVLQGGNVAMLKDLRNRISVHAMALSLPHATFYEDQDSLGGIITATGVLMPETLYDVTYEPEPFGDSNGSYVSNGTGQRYYNPMYNKSFENEFNLIQIVKSARLA